MLLTRIVWSLVRLYGPIPVVVFFGLLTPLFTQAQVSADFGANDFTGCSPLIVHFNDSSSGNITSRTWIFGNGNTATGNQTSVSAIYSQPGTYTVTLVVSNGINTDSITKVNYVTVYDNPIGGFTGGPTTGCVPLTATFNDNSIPAASPIVSWAWDFGDGSPLGSGSNPTHTYTIPGTFSVSCVITDANGCTASALQPNLISPIDAPIADFGALTATQACTPPLTVTFDNLTTGGGTNLTYQWNLGNNNTSTSANPTTTYSSTGSYDVTLIVSSGGCSDTIVKPNFVIVDQISAGFGLSPDSVCPGQQVSFYNQTYGGNNFNWDFGDGSLNTPQPSPTHSYANPGTYTVTLAANGGPGCDDTATATVWVENVEANFSVSDTYSCNPPLAVTYTDLSTPNVVSWEWFLGVPVSNPPIMSTAQNPSHVFPDPGLYSDTLVVTSALGCKDTLIKHEHVEVFVLDANWNADIYEGCGPLTVNFTDQSSPLDSIASWHWQFGDSLGTDTLQNPTFTFADTGIHMVTLTIMTPSGCVFEYGQNIYVGTKQTANFTADTFMACASDTVQFIDLSTDTTIIDHWAWAFGDSTFASGQNPPHQYQDTGWMDVTLVVSDNGCKDTLALDSLIYVSGPVIYLWRDTNCLDPYDVPFVVDLGGATNWWWDFGDGSPFDSVNANTQHTYTQTGSYWVKMYAENPATGCYHYDSILHQVVDIEAAIHLADTFVCSPALVEFDAFPSNFDEDWYWDIGNGQAIITSQKDTMWQFNSTGYEPIMLVAYDMYGCTDTAKIDVFLSAPSADFTPSITEGCGPLTVNLTDLSTSDTTITSWSWAFGNNTTSNQQNPSVTYPAGNAIYAIGLTVTDAIGCWDDEVRLDYIRVHQPPAYFWAYTEWCAGDSIQFYGPVFDPSWSYHWDFGDGDTSNAYLPWHSYAASGAYDVTLTVTDSFGCDSTFVRTDYIEIQSIPNLGFMATPTDSGCYPVPVTFTDTTGNPDIFSWVWDFGQGSPPVTVVGPVSVNTYTQPGSYDVTLWVETSFGCKDSVSYSGYINVGGPYAEFSVDDDTLCVGDTLTFTIDTASRVFEYTWDFGDGVDTVMAGNSTSISYVYGQTGTIIPRMIFIDSSGSCASFDEDSIYVHDVRAGFVLDRNEGCVPYEVQFTDTSFGANQWTWTFGDNNTSTLQNPVNTYTAPGDYTIRLIPTHDTFGCIDTAYQNIIVHGLPKAAIQAPDWICAGDSLVLNGFGGNAWSWQPQQLVEEPFLGQTLAWTDSSRAFGLLVTDTNGCQDTTWHWVDVQYPPTFLVAGDTTIFFGQEVDLWVNSLQNVQVQWTPSSGLSCSDCPFPIAAPEDSTYYNIRITDEYGCFSIDTGLYVNVDLDQALTVPTAFTPDGDGLNDVFFPVTYGLERLEFFQVFNRWGQLLYQTNEFGAGWDGFYKGRMSKPDVYVWQVRAYGYDGKIFYQEGYVVLAR